jgi:transcriptional regulator with XRE-family HTH domain
MPFVKQPDGEIEHVPMSGRDMRDLRIALGMARVEFGQLLGFTGENRNIYSMVKRYEEGRRPISPTVERLILMLGWFKEDFGYLPDLDRGERVPETMPPESTA